MVFGVFDGLHEGHRYFLMEALRQAQGDLVVVVAHDETVRQLKHKTPKFGELERVEAIRKVLPQASVVLGDQQQGSYNVVKTHRPAMICLGYDQRELGDDLRRSMREGSIPMLPLYEISRHNVSKL